MRASSDRKEQARRQNWWCWCRWVTVQWPLWGPPLLTHTLRSASAYSCVLLTLANCMVGEAVNGQPGGGVGIQARDGLNCMVARTHVLAFVALRRPAASNGHVGEYAFAHRTFAEFFLADAFALAPDAELPPRFVRWGAAAELKLPLLRCDHVSPTRRGRQPADAMTMVCPA